MSRKPNRLFLAGLNCECCGTELEFEGFSNTVACVNDDCLVYDHSFSYHYLQSRAEARKMAQPVPNKPTAPNNAV